MSSHSNSASSSPPRVPPHIRLNSGPQDLQTNDQGGQSRSLVAPRPQLQQLRTPLSQSQVYSSQFSIDSHEHLLPPAQSSFHKPRDHEWSPNRSTVSSRRTSWESDRTRTSDNSENPFRDSFNSRPASRAGSDEDVNTQTVSEKYNILPSEGLLLYPQDIEKDDYLHNPDPGGKEPRDCDVFTKRGIVNIGGLLLVTLGILILFIGYPVLTFVQKYTTVPDPCKDNPLCIKTNGKVSLLKNIRTGLIDPQTPESAKTKQSRDGSTWNLVFSDEFTTPGRTFFDGDDPYFTAVDIWYAGTQDMEWYDPDAATTNDGVLEIRFDAFQNHNLNYRSGMLQSWNQLCFKGGRLEASISLPGRGDTSGFWPGFWTMGNLGRAGYAATTEGMWPYSYADQCDAGITPNQSSSDGISWLPGMKLPACTCNGEDHPTPGNSRSAPEMDVIEATNLVIDSEGNRIGMASQTMQVAPFDIWWQPNYDFVEVYDPSITTMNVYKGGNYQQAFSGVSALNNAWYDGNAYQVYAFEYTPGGNGEVTWFIGDDATWRVTGDALGPNGNVGQRVISEEPMSILMNLAMGSSFSELNLTGIAPLLPAKLRFDYVRIYQDGNGQVTCDPPGYETTAYIEEHISAYTNPNYTTWDDAGYSWPKNTLMNGCSS